jgi:hypothetical protein
LEEAAREITPRQKEIEDAYMEELLIDYYGEEASSNRNFMQIFSFKLAQHNKNAAQVYADIGAFDRVIQYFSEMGPISVDNSTVICVKTECKTYIAFKDVQGFLNSRTYEGPFGAPQVEEITTAKKIGELNRAYIHYQPRAEETAPSPSLVIIT